ncbi:MAG: ABC transporter permease [Vicinamibacterales bacterium]
MRRFGVAVLVAISVVAFCAPLFAVHPPDLQHRGFAFAPPMPLRVHSHVGWQAPFYHPVRLDTTRGVRVFLENVDERVPLRLATGGRLMSGAAAQPWFPLGTDSLGRDVWSRLVFGARTSLAVVLCATALALLLGTGIGALAGSAGGWMDEASMRLVDLVIVLPSLYVVLALRSAMPLVLEPMTMFLALTGVLGVVGSPTVARGVRGIVAAEWKREHVTAAQALGASRWRIAWRHTLPAAGDFLLTQGLLLAPAFMFAESTLSLVGLGFAPPVASWGNMLQDAMNVRALADFPWVLTPALAISAVVLGITLTAGSRFDSAIRSAHLPTGGTLHK